MLGGGQAFYYYIGIVLCIDTTVDHITEYVERVQLDLSFNESGRFRLVAIAVILGAKFYCIKGPIILFLLSTYTAKRGAAMSILPAAVDSCSV